MKISPGQLRVRYGYLFPCDSDLETVKHLVSKFKELDLDLHRVAFKSNSIKYRHILLALHIYAIEKESKLIKADLLQAHDIVSAFFGANDDFRYPSLNGIDVPHLNIILGFAEPNPKKSVELVRYIMYRYYTDNKYLWLYFKKGNDIEKDCTDLEYNILDVDKIFSTSSTTVGVSRSSAYDDDYDLI